MSADAGRRALIDLGAALDLCAAEDADGVLFFPLNKGAMSQAGMTQEDELRWFAERLGYRGFTSELNFIDALVTARVAVNRFTEIGMLADVGIEAIIVPLVSTVADAEAAVRALDY
ncbi:4-hydroxythreonine-4-phosphate dehydrogenase PdxA, partial [Burkholderia multivorans]